MKVESATDILERLESGYSLPTLSVVALRLVELASDDTCSARNLADLIEKDPSLAVRLLKLANSALFQSAKSITTLEQAVVKVGFHHLRVMALSLSLKDTFPMGAVGSLDYEKFWKASLYRALLAKSLAQHLGGCNPEEAFVAGLILEIGLLILFDLVIKDKDEAIDLDRDSLRAFLEWERSRYGMDHRQVGEAALKYWRFPESIISSQRFYGKPALSKSAPPLSKICELARQFSRTMFHKTKDFHSLFDLADRVYGLVPEIINDILLGTFEQVQDIADNLRLELNREKDLMVIMEKANLALSEISGKMNTLQEGAEKRPLPSFESIEEDGGAVSRTLQAVAHEIRNPLLAVGGFAKKLAHILDPKTDGGKYAKAILDEASRLENALSKMTQKK